MSIKLVVSILKSTPFIIKALASLKDITLDEQAVIQNKKSQEAIDTFSRNLLEQL